MAIQLPKSFYREGIPIKGTRWLTRLGAILLPLLVFWGIYWNTTAYPLRKPPFQEPYQDEMVELANNKERARWKLYQGYQAYRDSGGFRAALSYYDRAVQLDTINVNAWNNLRRGAFYEARENYRSQNFTEAISGFQSIAISDSTMNRLGSRYAFPIGLEYPFGYLSFAGTYAKGLSLLYTGADSLGIIELYEAGRDPSRNESRKNVFQDSASIYNLAPDKEKVYRKLIEVSQRIQSETLRRYLDSLQVWMGREFPKLDQVEPLLAEATQSLELAREQEGQGAWVPARSNYIAAQQLFLDVLQLASDNPMALAGRDEVGVAIERVNNRLFGIEVERFLTQARGFLSAGNCDSATYYFRIALELDSGNEEAKRGIANCNEPNSKDSEEFLTQPRTLDPDRINQDSEIVKAEKTQDNMEISSVYTPLAKQIPDMSSIPEIEMIFVEGGNFRMGTLLREKDERPVKKISLEGFKIGKFEVTQEQWSKVMGSRPKNYKGRTFPINNISWKDAIIFCNTLSIAYNLEPVYSLDSVKNRYFFNDKANGYRLPTEAEWEFAASGGNKSSKFRFSGSNDLSLVGWYNINSSFNLHRVGKKNPNELGIYDMSGNVVEWCWDWYDSKYYSYRPLTNPKGPENGSGRVLRGGSWNYSASSCRVSHRNSLGPSVRLSIIGFRLARAVPGGQ